MPDRISSLDQGYASGDLSIFPEALDNKDTLYEAKNNAETKLKQTLTFSGKYIIVEDTSAFPEKGLIRIGPPAGKAGNYELIYYGQKNKNIFSNLVRGFAGSIQTQFNVGAWVTNAVMAEHHNAIKDAIIKIQKKLGKLSFPEEGSLNNILQELETRFLSPKPIFVAFPLIGAPPLKVRFQNYSGGEPIRFLWDFGDGSTSTEASPIHTYKREGVYSVKLNMITALGAQGVASKSNYITVSNDEGVSFFYSNTLTGISRQTAQLTNTTATEFVFIDQTQGPIIERTWNYDDGKKDTIPDADIHTTKHYYDVPGEYNPILLAILNSGRLKRIELADPITVI